MADLRDEILTDREQYPDETVITLQNGKTITVKEFRDGYLPKGEMTRMTEGWKQKERQYTEAYNGALQQAQDLQRQLSEAQTVRPTPSSSSTGELSEDELARDPVLGPIVRKYKAAEERMEAASKRLDAHEATLKTHAQTWQRAGFQSQLDRIKARPDAKDMDVNAFLGYVQRKPVIDMDTSLVDLESTYRNYAFDKLEKAAEARGEERGMEKGRTEARVPRIPMGRRRAATKDSGLPATLQDLTVEQVANDPAMQEAMGEDGLI